MKVTYRVHAVRRMFERGISEAQVREVLEGGEEITAYPDDRPYPAACCSAGGASGRSTSSPPIMRGTTKRS